MGSVITLHAVVLALTLALCAAYLLFILRPFKRYIAQETRRVAELLSQLPSEVDMDALLAATLMADLERGGAKTSAGAGNAGAPGAGGWEGAGKGGKVGGGSFKRSSAGAGAAPRAEMARVPSLKWQD